MNAETAQLWARLRPELTTYFEMHLPNPADAEDYVSDTFVALMENEGVTKPENLLRTIAKRLLVDEYRRNGIRKEDLDTRHWPGVKERSTLSLREQSDFSLADEPFISIEDQLFATDLYDTLRDLADDDRNAWILCELRGLTVREAAALLDASKSSVHSRWETVTADLREELSV